MGSDSKEIFVKAPWGKIALMTWGLPSLQPVLMVHGRQDTAATFAPLVRQLPQTYYYVSVDLPGNGRSDYYPKGLVVSRYHLLAVVDVVVKHMNWHQFIFMGHSMGCEVGLFFNAIWPGRIIKFIHLDAGPTFQRLQQPDHVRYYRHYYERYYGNYHRFNHSSAKVYQRQQALEAMMKARGVTEDVAEELLSRTLEHIGDNKYILQRFTWDPRVKYVAPQNATNDYYVALFTKDMPPSLLVSMSEGSAGVTRGKVGAEELIRQMVSSGNCRQIILEGGHDYHMVRPDEVARHVAGFLGQNGVGVKSKV